MIRNFAVPLGGLSLIRLINIKSAGQNLSLSHIEVLEYLVAIMKV